MRRRNAPPPPAVGDVPECLQAGPCIEVWAPDVKGEGTEAPWWVARRRFKAALALWLERNDATAWEWSRLPATFSRSSMPWSFDSLSATNPDRLAAHLDHRDLPPTWQPSPAPREWLVEAIRSAW